MFLVSPMYFTYINKDIIMYFKWNMHINGVTASVFTMSVIHMRDIN
jgi:hypothetical protein